MKIQKKYKHMQKISFAVLSFLLFGAVVWFFTAGKINIPENSFYPSVVQKNNESEGKHPTKTDFAILRDGQSSSERKKVVDELGSSTYNLDGDEITLNQGTYSESNKKRESKISDIFFSPTDNDSKEPIVILLSDRKDTERESSYYLAIRLLNGELTPGAFLGKDEHVHNVDIKNGVLTVTHHVSLKDPEVLSRFALTRQDSDSLPELEPVPDTVVMK